MGYITCEKQHMAPIRFEAFIVIELLSLPKIQVPIQVIYNLCSKSMYLDAYLRLTINIIKQL